MSALEEIAVDLAAERAAQEADLEKSKPMEGSPLSNWFSELTIGGKIRAFFFGNLIFALIAGVFVIYGYFQLGDRAESINTSHDNALAAEQLVLDLSEAQRHTEMFVATGDQTRASAAQARLEAASAKIEPLQGDLRGVNADVYEKLSVIGDGIEDFGRQISSFNFQDLSSVRAQSRMDEVTATGGVTLDAGLEVASLLSTEADVVSDSGTSLVSTLMVIWIVLASILTMLTLVAERYFSRNVSGTLTDMAGQMSKLASGDKDVVIPGKARKDEIGNMARAMEIFHRAGVRLERLSRERAENAKAELEEQARVQGEKEEAQLERERMLRDVADQFERTVGDIVSGVATASSQL